MTASSEDTVYTLIFTIIFFAFIYHVRRQWYYLVQTGYTSVVEEHESDLEPEFQEPEYRECFIPPTPPSSIDFSSILPPLSAFIIEFDSDELQESIWFNPNENSEPRVDDANSDDGNRVFSSTSHPDLTENGHLEFFESDSGHTQPPSDEASDDDGFLNTTSI
ncbi:hypothetical protein C8J56DRAFT_893365 [Mycena floridula]|nr:hypothetical protein C8J56DRAFT_893365 [Mycena floridula]